VKRTALIVDDARAIRLLIRAVLEERGFEALEAEDGTAAIELLDGRPCDLILCDLSMPRMGGLGFLRWLRNHPRYRALPVAIVTTETRPDVKDSVRTAGANAYLAKPFTRESLLSVVSRLCPDKTAVKA
jgi:two-component system chemotaxis response regulator CheY